LDVVRPYAPYHISDTPSREPYFIMYLGMTAANVTASLLACITTPENWKAIEAVEAGGLATEERKY
jgi:hypothetical protein